MKQMELGFCVKWGSYWTNGKPARGRSEREIQGAHTGGLCLAQNLRHAPSIESVLQMVLEVESSQTLYKRMVLSSSYRVGKEPLNRADFCQSSVWFLLLPSLAFWPRVRPRRSTARHWLLSATMDVPWEQRGSKFRGLDWADTGEPDY